MFNGECVCARECGSGLTICWLGPQSFDVYRGRWEISYLAICHCPHSTPPSPRRNNWPAWSMTMRWGLIWWCGGMICYRARRGRCCWYEAMGCRAPQLCPCAAGDRGRSAFVRQAAWRITDRTISCGIGVCGGRSELSAGWPAAAGQLDHFRARSVRAEMVGRFDLAKLPKRASGVK